MNLNDRRVIVIHWKKRPNSPFDVFSSLKNLCLSYPQFNYHTVSNYLSKAKVAYENENVRIERKQILSSAIKVRKIVPVLYKGLISDTHEEIRDLEYWLSKPPEARIEAATFIIMQSIKEGQKMDKTNVTKGIKK